MTLEPTAIAVLGLVGWSLALLVAIALLRSGVTIFTGRPANTYAPSGDDVSPFSGRLCRAHANCYEFIPFALAILLYAIATDQTHVTDGLALILLFARVAQSSIHIISTSRIAVTVRFFLILPQVGIVFYWLALLVLQPA